LGFANPPQLYAQPNLQSPVHGAADDLLFLAGDRLSADDSVVYMAVGDAGAAPASPRELPLLSDAKLGLGEVVGIASVPYGLTIRLPRTLRDRQAYALWVVSKSGEWSNPAFINDARPLWITPAFAYSSASIASLPRYLKVVGRNLQSAVGKRTEVRLEGPQQWTLPARPASTDVPTLGDYVALVSLPPKLIAGIYKVSLRVEGGGFHEIADQRFEVLPDPGSAPPLRISDPKFGGCRPDDGRDDTACLRQALAAARLVGGTVVLDEGVWEISERLLQQPDGILVPDGVSLRGAGRERSVLLRTADAKAPAGATFTLQGHNTIAGITFRDARRYGSQYTASWMLQIGAAQSEELRQGENEVDDVIIADNRFDRPNIAIKDGGLPIKRLMIVSNLFGANWSAIELAGNRYRTKAAFDLVDAVISGNQFMPGSYFAPAERQGAIASEVGASQRVDFSRNVADGASSAALNSPDDPHGWRAAFFWHMNNNHEKLLVSENFMSCTGDKAGDGEALSFDNNANTFALARAATVSAADTESVSIEGPLAGQQNQRGIDRGSYYVGHWVQIGAGPGLGQVRKIVAYNIGPSKAITLRISPAWDVVPQAGASRLNIGREFWQVYVLANTVDHRQPLCQKSNHTNPKGGGIVMWGQNADSVIAANRQFDSDGITVQHYYNAEEPGCPDCHAETLYADFLEIRDNRIDGEYRFDDDCSSSGIFLSLAAAPTPHSVPPTVGFGLSVAHNSIARADGWHGGAISLVPTWFEGPAPYRWPLIEGVLIQHNTLEGLSAPPAKACRGALHARTGISLDNAAGLARSTVLYANSCDGARRRVSLGNAGATAVCEPGRPASCECSP
jgi:hypothetical protein